MGLQVAAGRQPRGYLDERRTESSESTTAWKRAEPVQTKLITGAKCFLRIKE